MTGLVSVSLSCRVTLRPVRKRLPPSGTTTGFCSASANTSTTPSSMGKQFTSMAQTEPWESLLPTPFSTLLNSAPPRLIRNLCFCWARLQDISSGYWVLVLHFTRREAVRQIDELQHIATNLGRSKFPPSTPPPSKSCQSHPHGTAQ